MEFPEDVFPAAQQPIAVFFGTQAVARDERIRKEAGRFLLCSLSRHDQEVAPMLQQDGKMADGDNVFGGQMRSANAQWNRGKSEPRAWPEKYAIPVETLAKYGYANKMEYRNWRWF